MRWIGGRQSDHVEDRRGVTVFRGVMPFVVAQIILIAILVAVPDIALWLPATMK